MNLHFSIRDDAGELGTFDAHRQHSPTPHIDALNTYAVTIATETRYLNGVIEHIEDEGPWALVARAIEELQPR